MHVMVSDRYRAGWNRLGRPFSAPSLRPPAFHGHARHLAGALRRLDVPFEDLTAELAAAEANGPPLFLGYDSHMNERGYAIVAARLRRAFERLRRSP